MPCREKIKPLGELEQILAAFRAGSNKNIVLCHGCFDLLHIGHIRHLEQARKYGDLLVVTVTPDHFVNKGPNRPAFRQELRAEALAALDCVDYVAINEWPTAVETIMHLKPQFYAKGAEYSDGSQDLSGKIGEEEAAIRSVGGQPVFTNGITFSSSRLINTHFPAFPREVTHFLDTFRSRYDAGEVLSYVQGSRSLRVLALGEAIIDDYHYCETLGKSGKEPILAARFVKSEKSAGGSLAVANHLAALSDHVGLLTVLGAEDSQLDFIEQKLDPKIQKYFLYRKGAPTVVKRRFVETYPFQKLFEVYIMDDGERDPGESKQFLMKLEELLPQYDVVIINDYGHGMIGPEAVKMLCQKAAFLAVNTQLNAANHGFNTVSKYASAEYICVSEREIRLDARSRRKDLADIVSDVAERLSCNKVLVTRGRSGCLSYGREEGFFEIPAFTDHFEDRIGAGDAVFSVTSLAVALGAPMAVVGFIGNAVGSQAVRVVGNQSYTQFLPLLRYIEALLK